MKKYFKKTVDGIKNRDFVEGVSSDWFLRRFPFIVVVIFFSLTYIALRYDCKSSQKQIIELTEMLNAVRTDSRAEQAIYMSATGESAMLRQAEALGLDLHLQDRPPYIIETDK